MPEAELALAGGFLHDILSSFVPRGLCVFEKTVTTTEKPRSAGHRLKGFWESGYEDVKGLVVCKGSQLAKAEKNTLHEYTSTMRKALLAQAGIADQTQRYAFTQDHVLTPPLTAADVILGRTANGRIEWKSSDGRTLKQLPEAAAKEGRRDG